MRRQESLEALFEGDARPSEALCNSTIANDDVNGSSHSPTHGPLPFETRSFPAEHTDDGTSTPGNTSVAITAAISTA
jgi:hypothetical protein